MRVNQPELLLAAMMACGAHVECMCVGGEEGAAGYDGVRGTSGLLVCYCPATALSGPGL